MSQKKQLQETKLFLVKLRKQEEGTAVKSPMQTKESVMHDFVSKITGDDKDKKHDDVYLIADSLQEAWEKAHNAFDSTRITAVAEQDGDSSPILI